MHNNIHVPVNMRELAPRASVGCCAGHRIKSTAAIDSDVVACGYFRLLPPGCMIQYDIKGPIQLLSGHRFGHLPAMLYMY